MIKVFISHSSRDKKFVRTLKEDLNENGIETWFDEDQLDLGDSLLEKLDESLEGSTHFIIILSSNAVNSDWVKFELNKAISRVQKIIPIKYRECEIPREINGLLYADLSKETVRVVSNKIEFTTEGYTPFLNRLVKTLKTPTDKKLTNQDKVTLKDELMQNESLTSKDRDLISTLFLQVEPYATVDSKKQFINKVGARATELDSSTIRPIILPRIMKNIFRNIQIGDQLRLSHNSNSYQIAHFAGFRRDDLKITVDPDSRKAIGIKKHIDYNVRFDGNDNSINFIDG